MPTDQTWTNWSGNLHSQPVEIAMPSNTAEVRDLMRNRRGRTIRAFGTCHSMSPLIVNDGGVVVDLSKFTEGGRKAWRWQNKGQDLVSFLPSARWADVREALTTTQDPSLPRMYLSTTGALATINATGFVAAGCHGTGWHQPTISDLVYAVEFVGADGGVHSFSEDTTPDDMAAVRVNFGMLGIITKLTLRAEPMYRLHDRERIVPIEEIMGWNPLKTNWDSDDAEEPVETRYLHRLVTENDYVELFWFPGSGFDGEIWVKQFNRTTESVRDVPPRWNGWEEYVAAAVMGWSAKHPAVWDLINPGTWSTVKGRVEGIGQGPSKGTFVAEAPDVLFYVEQAFPILDFEMAIPIPSAGPSTWDLSNVVTAWWGAVNYAHKFERFYPITTCVHARFTRSSQALLSSAYSPRAEDRFCWIEVVSAYPKTEPNATVREGAMASYHAMISELMPQWIHKMGGRPHWAKNWQYIKPLLDMGALFPASNFETFNKLRRRLDPEGMFLNTFLREQNLFR